MWLNLSSGSQIQVVMLPYSVSLWHGDGVGEEGARADGLS